MCKKYSIVFKKLSSMQCSRVSSRCERAKQSFALAIIWQECEGKGKTECWHTPNFVFKHIPYNACQCTFFYSIMLVSIVYIFAYFSANT